MTEYNPADHNVDDVKAHIEENPQDAKAVLEAEQSGENRVTLVEHLHGVVDGQHEAPVAAEPTAVTVAPADQSELKTDTVLGKNYEVTAERGYRVQR